MTKSQLEAMERQRLEEYDRAGRIADALETRLQGTLEELAELALKSSASMRKKEEKLAGLLQASTAGLQALARAWQAKDDAKKRYAYAIACNE